MSNDLFYSNVNAKRAVIASVVFLLSACSSLKQEEDFEKSIVDDSEWSAYIQEQTDTQTPTEERWWQSFDDPILNELLVSAMVNNLDLALARERVVESRAVADQSISGFGPQLGVDASVTAQRQSETSFLPVGRFPEFEADNTIYSGGFDAAWEVDLFGRKNITNQLGNLITETSEESQRSVRVSLSAEIARVYFDLRSAQIELAATTANINHQAELVELTQVKQNYGEATQIDVQRASLLQSDYEAKLPSLDARIRANQLRLRILTGKPANETNLDWDMQQIMPQGPTVIATGLSSELLRRRPDVRRAERNYQIAVLQTELTQVSTYPRFSLFASAGPETIALSDLFDSSSLALALGAMVDWDILDGGRRDAELAISESQLRQAEITYRQSVMAALEEVEVAASNYLFALEAAKKRTALVDSHERLNTFARERYAAGSGTLLEVLESDRQLGDAKLMHTRAEAQRITALVSLYKSLGGGWSSS